METQNNALVLHERLLKLVKLERRITSKVLDLLQAIENNRSYLEWGYSNLFEYLVKGLGYSESLAYQRKAALKICEAIPEIKQKLDEGSLSLTTLARANKVLNTKTISEKRELLLELENKPSFEVDKILAREMPLELKSPGPAKRYVNGSTIRLTLDLSEEEYKKLEKLKALKSHQTTDVKTLINLLVDQELTKYSKTNNSPSKSQNPRQIKISLKNHLLQKANYKCQYPGCNQNHFLQVDHIKSVSKNGSNQPENLQVLCQAHNKFKYRQHG
ncbi:MAG: HNH endonuclease signature motif containing protein [Bdellovibrionota bacterium]